MIIGAGPAGLTAALELVKSPGLLPIVLEADAEYVGGISRTVNYKGNRIDIGGHRFFSKSDVVMQWWHEMLQPEEQAPASAGDDVMLTRRRLSRIYFRRHFFDYPLSLSLKTLQGLGLLHTAQIGLSYARAKLFPIPREKNLEDFLINRFGRTLYDTFFREYTEKVWGVPCREISPEWGGQRIKGLSVTRVLLHALKQALQKVSPALAERDVSQKSTETSLIERFLYPKYGPGQMWEKAARELQARGGELHMGMEVTAVEVRDGRAMSVTARDVRTGETCDFGVDAVVSSMPVKDLVAAMGSTPPERVRDVAQRLAYRDFITVGLLADRLEIRGADGGLIPDNWVYIQEPGVKVGRLQVFNNWSPWMVADPERVWIGLEYFVFEGDRLWCMDDAAFSALAAEELERIGILDRGKVRDSVVIRMKKAYPSYIGAYDDFNEIRSWVDTVENLYLIGRNGMHRYNNQDHSMLTALEAARQIVSGHPDPERLWSVNTEQEYHEEKTESPGGT